MQNTAFKQLNLSPVDIARYMLFRALEDGDVVSPLRMQKLVYYAYAKTLANTGQQLFQEEIQAWRNGPVVYSLYKELKQYGSDPISSKFLNGLTYETFNTWSKKTFPADVIHELDEVYMTYIQKSPFELVVETHREDPWINARAGLEPTDNSKKPISDLDIVSTYSV